MSGLPFAARADVVYESATFGSSVSSTSGQSTANASQWLGARFTLEERTRITRIGGHVFSFFAGQTLFAAIVPLEQDGFPIDPVGANPPDLASVALASTVFAVPTGSSGDALGDVDVVLPAGTYGLVIGGGAFGATGFSVMPDTNDDVSPSPSRFFWEDFDNIWRNDALTGIRFIVEGSVGPAVPIMDPRAFLVVVAMLLAAPAALARARYGADRGRRRLRR